MKVNGVIGANGFIGSRILKVAPLFSDQTWVGITREDPGLEHSYDRLIWAAGYSSKIGCEENPERCMTKNVSDLLKYLKVLDFQHFIYISSQAVYPWFLKQPKEEQASPRHLSSYGLSKWFGEACVKNVCENRYTIIRPHGFVGPGLKKNVVFDLTQTYPRLYVGWDSKFQFIHTDVFARILMEMNNHRYLGQAKTYNITSLGYVSPADVAQMVRVDPSRINLVHGEESPVHNSLLDTSLFFNSVLRDLEMEMPSMREQIKKWNEDFYI